MNKLKLQELHTTKFVVMTGEKSVKERVIICVTPLTDKIRLRHINRLLYETIYHRMMISVF